MEDETLPPAAPLPATLPANANVIANKTGAGILMRTLKRGDGLHFPTPGDSCLIHYEGTLENGTKIAGSRDLHQAPLQFQLGARHILEGLEVAVENMSVGQIVEATIPALYAYGHQGFPPRIPPSSTLIFRIELLEIIQQPMEERLQALRQH